MKSLTITFTALLLFIGLASFQSIPTKTTNISFSPADLGLEISTPDNVKAVLDRSCLPCHGVDGSRKAKFKWNYTKMSNMSSSKVISKLNKVIKEIDKEKMPPQKYIKKHPEVELSDANQDLLKDWAKELIKTLDE